MTTRIKAARYALAFSLGFAFGIGLLFAYVWFAARAGQDPPLPGWWQAWVFDANPVVLVACNLMQRRDLCIGLGFDSGPLQWSERTWLLLAQGMPFGLLSVFLLRLRARRARRRESA